MTEWRDGQAPAAAGGQGTHGVLPMQMRLAPVVATTLDAEKRTVEVIWSSGARVRRYDWMRDRYYNEELDLAPASVRMDRLNAGAPVLAAHDQYRIEGVIGVVERAWIVNGEGRAVVRFSERDEVAPIWQDVVGGILRNISVGYIVHKYEVTENVGEPPLYRAVDWEPMEISLVGVGADPKASVRGADTIVYPCTISPRQKEAEIMDDPVVIIASGEPTPARAMEPSNPPTEIAIDVGRERSRAVETERTRAAEIRRRVRAVALSEETADELVAQGVSAERAAEMIIDRLAARGGPVARPRIETGPSGDDPAALRETMAEALVARAAARSAGSRERVEPSGRAREFMNWSVLEMCADLARARGERVERNLPAAALYHRLTQLRSLSTSDFPILLADAGNKIMIKAYEVANPTYRLVFARKTFTDFKPHKFIRAGDFPVPVEKGETGEFKFGAMGEAKQDVTLLTYGRIVGLSRQVLVNDDMAAFADLPVKIGRRIADFENSTAWAVLALNSGNGPAITETGRNLFNTTDNTVAAAGAVISVTTVGAGRAAMMKKTSIDGLKLNVAPRWLVTSPDKFTDAEAFLSPSVVPSADSAANPFKGKLTALGDANLTGNAWYLFAEPMDLDTLMYGYLEGAEGPQLSSREGFTTDGVDLRVSLDFVASAIDFRGAWKNPGA